MSNSVEHSAALLLEKLGNDNERHPSFSRLRSLFGDRVPALLRWQYQRSSKWQDRVACIFCAIPYARWSDDAFFLGLDGLDDKSSKVRYRAIELLAFACKPTALDKLKRKLGQEKKGETCTDILAAIDAIDHKNHHYFVDRDHTGQAVWAVLEILPGNMELRHDG